MKRLLLIMMVFGFAGQSWGQVEIKDKTIYIDAGSKVKSFETVLDFKKKKDFDNDIDRKKPNTYTLFYRNPNNYIISIKRKANMSAPLDIDKTSENNKSQNAEEHLIGTITFQRNTEYVFTIKGMKSDDEEIEHVYKIKTQTDWSWTTTFGANAVFYTNHNKFVSQKTESGEYSVVNINDKKNMDLMPSVMFTFQNNQMNFSPGITGGLGFNLQELAVFFGGSLGFGQNIILTGGVAVHKQNRPNTNFYEGQIIDSEITTDMLNEKQYRVNPFIGLSFRLNKNPFKETTE